MSPCMVPQTRLGLAGLVSTCMFPHAHLGLVGLMSACRFPQARLGLAGLPAINRGGLAGQRVPPSVSGCPFWRGRGRPLSSAPGWEVQR